MRDDKEYQEAVDRLKEAESYFNEATGIWVDYAFARLDAAKAVLKAEIMRVKILETIWNIYHPI